MERYGTKNSKLYNVLAVLVGALLLGFLWRVRGEHGWGSSWGLLNAGFVFALYLCVVAGARKKMNFIWVSLTAASFMLTTPSWGTLLNQITGVMDSIDGNYENMTNTWTVISPWSGVIMMLLMGFGLSAIFGIMLGRGFSDKQWKWWHFAVVIGSFLAVKYIAMATVAHPIVELIQPESAESFERGLQTAGIEYDSVYKIYLQHFNDLSWAKKIGGGRNYFSEIQAVASTLSAIAAIIATLVVVKDKVAAKFGTISCAAFAFAITVSDIIFYFAEGGYHREQGLTFPKWIGGGWSCWEFCTGFLAGGLLTLAVLLLKKKDDVDENAFAFLPEKPRTALGFIISFLFVAGANVVRPVLERFKECSPGVLITAIVVVLAVYIAFICVYLKKNGKNFSMNKFAPLMVVIMTLYDLAVYMFISPSKYINITGDFSLLEVLMFASAIAVTAFCVVSSKKVSNAK